MTHSGKIGRLPHHLREMLNCRLADGETGPRVLEWLNGLPKVQEILEQDFGGRAISEQNLSEWRQRGFRDWQKQQETCEHVRRLADQSDALDEAADGENVTDRLSIVFSVELFKVLEQLLEKSADDRERLGYLRQGLREIRLLRRGDHNLSRLKLESERWERQRDQENEAQLEKMKQESKSHLLHKIYSEFTKDKTAELFGGGETGRLMAELITRIELGERLDDLKKPRPAASPSNGSNVPDQTKSK